MILKQIAIQDFLSHSDTLIHLEDGDKLLLDGVSGSGKSSVIDALLWCLYGTGRVENRSLIRRGAKEAFVAVTLFDREAGMYYEIQRTVAVGKHTVEVFEGKDLADMSLRGTGGIRDTEAYIVKEILGASYQLFINSVVFPQDNAESFVTATSVRRKELLLEILKTADISEHLEKSKELIAEKTSETDLLKGAVENSTSRIGAYEEEVKSLPAVQEEIVAIEAGVVEKKRLVSEAMLSKRIIDEKYATVRDDEMRLKSLQNSQRLMKHVDNPEELIQQYEAELVGAGDATSELMRAIEHNNEISAARSDLGSLDQRDYDMEISSIQRRITQLLESVPPCPAGPECPASMMVEKQVAILVKDRKDLEDRLNQKRLSISEYEKKIATLGEIISTNDLQMRVERFASIQNELRGLREMVEQKKIQEEIEQLAIKLTNAPTISGVERAARSLEECTVNLSKTESLLGERRGNENYLKHLITEIGEINESIGDSLASIAVLEEEVELLSELREALGTKGITAIAIDMLLPAIEDSINEILSMLSDFRVELSTQKDSVTGGTVEGLFITVSNAQGEEFDLNSYSGGERVRISVAIVEALARLQRCNFRIIDEGISALDEDMVDNFVKVLGKIQSQYSQSIMISHIPAVKDVYEKKITIKKLDGISRVC